MIYFWKQIINFIPALIIPVVVGSLMNFYIDLYNIKTFLLCGVLYVIAFLISIWLLGMNQFEKDLIRRPLIKIIKKFKSSLNSI